MSKKYIYSKPSDRTKTRHIYPKSYKSTQPSPKFKFHGNYCGPNYCGGKFDGECDYSVDPIDSLDEICKQHDYNYEKVQNYSAADNLAAEQAGRIPGFRSNVLSGYFRSGINRLVYKDRSSNPVSSQTGVRAIHDPARLPTIRSMSSQKLKEKIQRYLMNEIPDRDLGIATGAIYLFTTAGAYSSKQNDFTLASFNGLTPNYLNYNPNLSPDASVNSWTDLQGNGITYTGSYSQHTWLKSFGMHSATNTSADPPQVCVQATGQIPFNSALASNKYVPLLDGGVYEINVEFHGYLTPSNTTDMLTMLGCSDNFGTGNLYARGAKCRIVSILAAFPKTQTLSNVGNNGINYSVPVWTDVHFFDFDQFQTCPTAGIGSATLGGVNNYDKIYVHSAVTEPLNPNNTIVHAVLVGDKVLYPSSSAGNNLVLLDNQNSPAHTDILNFFITGNNPNKVGIFLVPGNSSQPNGVITIAKQTDQTL